MVAIFMNTSYVVAELERCKDTPSPSSLTSCEADEDLLFNDEGISNLAQSPIVNHFQRRRIDDERDTRSRHLLNIALSLIRSLHTDLDEMR